MYYICKMTDDGHWEALDNLPSYSEADAIIDNYFDLYPFAYIDILSQATYEASQS